MDIDTYNKLNNLDNKLDLILLALGYEYNDERGFYFPDKDEKVKGVAK